MSTFTGGCHCGAIRYECAAEPGPGRHCQCTDCRRLSGSGHVSSMEIPLAALHVSGQPRSYDTRSESGNVVTRRFCATCGTPLFSTNSALPGRAFLRASSLDDPALFKPQAVIWSSSAVAWDMLDPALPRFPKGRPPARP
jgi:hypothetical protein